MGDEVQAVAARMRPPGWRDPRLVVGVLLIVVAVVGVAASLRAADRTSPVYAAAGALAPGTVLEESDLVVAHVRVGQGYLAAPADAPFGRVLTRAVGEGELVPASAVAAREDFDGRPVAVTASSPVADGVEAGALVDVWVTPEDGSSTRVGESLPVSAVEREEGSFGLGGETVYVVVPEDRVGALLDALATAAEVAVVGIG
ncbi:SAF domain-containing protein [Demequina sp. SYSU T00192]|uniref:SAF domain-containing protein n=1 Tax=Demequina litoralis TaxID=3051660 RepID=A0ABT8G880_9MICO|nr:SAF domain-containing protein [Demequina sp. SYSU T00192]MDN4474889.1 SAF domain-containing protein [Demequina sp. SYSU T00192]